MSFEHTVIPGGIDVLMGEEVKSEGSGFWSCAWQLLTLWVLLGYVQYLTSGTLLVLPTNRTDSTAAIQGHGMIK